MRSARTKSIPYPWLPRKLGCNDGESVPDRRSHSPDGTHWRCPTVRTAVRPEDHTRVVGCIGRHQGQTLNQRRPSSRIEGPDLGLGLELSTVAVGGAPARSAFRRQQLDLRRHRGRLRDAGDLAAAVHRHPAWTGVRLRVHDQRLGRRSPREARTQHAAHAVHQRRRSMSHRALAAGGDFCDPRFDQARPSAISADRCRSWSTVVNSMLTACGPVIGAAR